jgi:uncharacterized protein YbbC (DUF1343 family)
MNRGQAQQYTRKVVFCCTAVLCLGCQASAPLPAGTPAPAAQGAVVPGVEVWQQSDPGDLAGKRIGLITNHTGRTRAGVSTIDVLSNDSRIKLVALFGLEHGIRGAAEGGINISDTKDEKTGLPIYSLYSTEGNYRPTAAQMRQLDALVFDIQDVGARYYTYVWNMIMAMEFAAEMRKTFVVFDRPDPIGGELVQGPTRQRRDIVGLYPVTSRYGLTVGEVARWVNGEFKIGADLRVIPMQGWRRSMYYGETGIPWIPPSPNMPSPESALHYPGTCIFEGTNLSVGRGTPIAFQQLGAPWLNHTELANRLNAKNLPGVRFEAVTFTPASPGDQKFNGVSVNGIKLSATDRARYNPVVTSINILVELKRLHGDSLRFGVAHFDRLIGSPRVREQIVAGAAVAEITRDWDAQVEAFRRSRAPYLLYQ